MTEILEAHSGAWISGSGSQETRLTVRCCRSPSYVYVNVEGVLGSDKVTLEQGSDATGEGIWLDGPEYASRVAPNYGVACRIG